MAVFKQLRLPVSVILKRQSTAITHKTLYRSMHESAYEIGMPQRNLFSDKTEGSKRMRKIYDSTGMVLVEDLRNLFMNKITPAFKRWSEAQAGTLIPDFQKKKFNTDAEELTDKFFDHINASNFNNAIGQSYYDFTAGTMAFLILPGNDEFPLNFVSVPISEVALEQGAFGTVSAVYRNHDMTTRTILETWPDAKMRGIIENDMDSKLEIIEATYKGTNGQVFYDVILKENSERIVARDLNYMPWITPRIGLIPGEVYGRGPLIAAAPDLHMLNKMTELSLKHGQMGAFGIYLVRNNDVVNVDNLELNPGTLIPVTSTGGPRGPSIAPLSPAGNVNFEQAMIQNTKQQASKVMRVPRLPSDLGPVRSATEIMARLREIRETTAPFLGSVTFEFIQPLWQAVLSILAEKKLIKLTPKTAKVNNYLLKIKILSPIAKEQALEDVDNTVHALEIVHKYGGEQALMLGYKMEDMPEEIGTELGMPSKLIRSKEEREEMMQKLQQAQQQAAAAEQQQTEG